MSRVHILLGIQTLIIFLGSVNRLSTLTQGYALPNQFLRWTEIHNMLTLPLISVTAFYVLKKLLERGATAARPIASVLVSTVFLMGVYIMGASYGDHEVSNYLHGRFCDPVQPADASQRLCNIIIFNDDEFGHWTFFTGFVMINAAMLLVQAMFRSVAQLTRRDAILLAVNGVFVGLGIFANLGFEEIGLDLYVVIGLAAMSLFMLLRRGSQPMFVYYSVAYVLGIVLTGAVKLAQR